MIIAPKWCHPPPLRLPPLSGIPPFYPTTGTRSALRSACFFFRRKKRKKEPRNCVPRFSGCRKSRRLFSTACNNAVIFVPLRGTKIFASLHARLAEQGLARHLIRFEAGFAPSSSPCNAEGLHTPGDLSTSRKNPGTAFRGAFLRYFTRPDSRSAPPARQRLPSRRCRRRSASRWCPS